MNPISSVPQNQRILVWSLFSRRWAIARTNGTEWWDAHGGLYDSEPDFVGWLPLPADPVEVGPEHRRIGP